MGGNSTSKNTKVNEEDPKKNEVKEDPKENELQLIEITADVKMAKNYQMQLNQNKLQLENEKYQLASKQNEENTYVLQKDNDKIHNISQNKLKTENYCKLAGENVTLTLNLDAEKREAQERVLVTETIEKINNVTLRQLRTELYQNKENTKKLIDELNKIHLISETKLTEDKCRLAKENHALITNLDAEKRQTQELQNQILETEKLREDLNFNLKNLRTELIQNNENTKQRIDELNKKHLISQNNLTKDKYNLARNNHTLTTNLDTEKHRTQELQNQALVTEKLTEDLNVALEKLRTELIQNKKEKEECFKWFKAESDALQTNKLLTEKLHLEYAHAMELQSKQLHAEKLSVEKLRAKNTMLAEKLQAKNHQQETSNILSSVPCAALLCMNARFGCTCSVKDEELRAHGQSCFFRLLSCPLQPCSWNGNYNNLYSHAIDAHVRNTGMAFGKFTKVSAARDTQVLRKGQQLFLMHCRAASNSGSWAWTLQLLGPTAEAAKWKYEVSISAPQEPKRKVVMSDKCLSDCENVEKLVQEERCAVIPHLTLRNYIHNNKITLNLLVYKKNYNTNLVQ